MHTSPALRVLLGFFAGAFSVLSFHQGLVGALHALSLPGLELARVPYDMTPVPPFGVPSVLNLAFWGGVYGCVFGLVAPKLGTPYWLSGLFTGVVASVIGMFAVAAIKGNPIGGGWELDNWVRSLLVNGVWGVGLGLIFPLMLPQRHAFR
jgi:hypothetical protein